MLRVFKGEPSLGDKLAGRRNWCEVWQASSSISARNQPLLEYQVAAQGSLVFTLRLEVNFTVTLDPPPLLGLTLSQPVLVYHISTLRPLGASGYCLWPKPEIYSQGQLNDMLRCVNCHHLGGTPAPPVSPLPN